MDHPKQDNVNISLEQNAITKEAAAEMNSAQVTLTATDSERKSPDSQKNTIGSQTKPDEQGSSAKPHQRPMKQSEIKKLDTYYRCYMSDCDYVNKHSNDIGGHHFGKDKHPGQVEVWKIELVHMFQRPAEGAPHIEYKRSGSNKGGKRQWVAFDSKGTEDADNVIENDEEDECKDDGHFAGSGSDAKFCPSAGTNQATPSAHLVRQHLKRDSKASAKTYAGMNFDGYQSQESPSNRPKKKAKINSLASVNIDSSTVRTLQRMPVYDAQQVRVDALRKTPDGYALYRHGRLDEAREQFKQQTAYLKTLEAKGNRDDQTEKGA